MTARILAAAFAALVILTGPHAVLALVHMVAVAAFTVTLAAVAAGVLLITRRILSEARP